MFQSKKHFEYKVGDLVWLYQHSAQNPYQKDYLRKYTIYKRRPTLNINIYYLKNKKGQEIFMKTYLCTILQHS